MQRKRKKNTYDESILWKLPRHESISCESSAFVVCKNALIRRDDITKNFYYNIALPEVVCVKKSLSNLGGFNKNLKYPSFSKVPFIFDFQEILISISCRPKNFLYIVDVTVVLVTLLLSLNQFRSTILIIEMQPRWGTGSGCNIDAYTDKCLVKNTSLRVLYSWFGDYIKQQQKLKQ
ncbi:hypothetical protein GQX74_002366 [Glossina fuscipes]|nr:hypothetical protein GQX74_002366 [Glossina fuscipes]